MFRRCYQSKLFLIVLCLWIVILISCGADSSNEKIELILITNEGEEIYTVDKNIEKLFFNLSSFKKDVLDIKGLEKLPKLIHFQIEMSISKLDLSYLTKAKGLQIIALSAIHVESLDFIKELPNLQQLLLEIINYSEVDKLGNMEFDFINNPKLEYFYMARCSLNAVPKIKNVPQSLKIINLKRNNISEITPEFLKEVKDVETVVLYKNNIESTEYNNIVLENIDTPKKYIHFTM